MEGHLLQRREGREDVPREEAELVVMEKEGPEGGQVAEGGGGVRRLEQDIRE